MKILRSVAGWQHASSGHRAPDILNNCRYHVFPQSQSQVEVQESLQDKSTSRISLPTHPFSSTLSKRSSSPVYLKTKLPIVVNKESRLITPPARTRTTPPKPNPQHHRPPQQGRPTRLRRRPYTRIFLHACYSEVRKPAGKSATSQGHHPRAHYLRSQPQPGGSTGRIHNIITAT